ncbi:hypothetical protein CEXT_1321 [Caerostris extrusa]|uniref:VPS37 C-terminal domain-containing protein n=1 Tax=Caerostris extrusa TaxID=172846 RepID=A0AAV4MR57_CAEEX|nr:hypothetical protein CEXT_1321 [Caerostris extrusa]
MFSLYIGGKERDTEIGRKIEKQRDTHTQTEEEGKMNSSLFTPDYSHLTGLLQHLNDDELKELLNNEEKIKTLVNDLKQVHDIEAEREMVFAKKRKKIESYQQNTSKETILALLQAATSEKEEEAEAAVNAFLENEISVEDFLLRYLEVRKMAHLRRTKAEKMVNLLLTNGSIPTPPVRSQKLRKPPPPPATNTGVPVMPYPSNPVPQSNFPVPIRQAPQHPPVFNNVPQVPYPPGATYYPNQMRPPSYGYGPYPNYQYPQPPRFGHYK